MLTRTLTHIPASQIDAVRADFEAAGWTVQVTDEGDGFFTLIATHDDPQLSSARSLLAASAPKTKPRRKGISLHLGLNAVDADHYGGWDGTLNACEADAEDMNAIAGAHKFATTMLLTKNATRAKFFAKLRDAAKRLAAGDIFFLSYSGHGGQLPDQNGDEADGMDETWCLYDGEVVDDEIYQALSQFKPGVRVLVLSDSCHSGTVTKALHYANLGLSGAPPAAPNVVSGVEVAYRAMPAPVALRTYRDHRAFYDKILKDASLVSSKARITASVLLISGCMDNQLSSDGQFNGLFTGTLLRIWNEGQFAGTYADFYKAILGRMPPQQSPNLYWAADIDPVFLSQRPFSL